MKGLLQSIFPGHFLSLQQSPSCFLWTFIRNHKITECLFYAQMIKLISLWYKLNSWNAVWQCFYQYQSSRILHGFWFHSVRQAAYRKATPKTFFSCVATHNLTYYTNIHTFSFRWTLKGFSSLCSFTVIIKILVKKIRDQSE